VDITEGIAAITSAAKFINYAVEDCATATLATGNANVRRECGEDISSAITEFASASKEISTAVYTCGGQSQSCSADISEVVEALSASTKTLISASSNCEKNNTKYDTFQCIICVFDVVDTLTHASKALYEAADDCAKAEEAAAAEASE